MSNLIEQLKEQAKAKGICTEGYHNLCILDKDALVDYYLSIPDWCLERDFPSYPMLHEHFADCEDKGVYVGKTFHGEILNEHQSYIFHNCKGTVKVGLSVEQSIIPMLYVANGCRLRFVGAGDYAPKNPDERSIVPVYSFGKNDISARDNRYVKFHHYKNELI